MFVKKQKRILIIGIAVVMTAIILAVVIWKTNQKTMSYEEKVEAFVNENPNLKQGQIVFVGDSITAGYSLKSYYRDLKFETYNRGISGDTANWLLARMQVSVIDIAPSEIVLMIGTNDINGGKSAEEIAKDYERILEWIATDLPQTKVFCISIIPQNHEYSENAAENNERIKETNAKIEILATERGYQYINLYDELTDQEGFLKRNYSTDGLHLSSRGYRIWTNVMKSYLK